MNKNLNKEQLAQYFTPRSVARIMVEMVKPKSNSFSILDPGSGEGILSILLVEHLLGSGYQISHIDLVVIEIDPSLIKTLEENLIRIQNYAKSKNVNLNYQIYNEDFIDYSIRKLSAQTLFDGLEKSDYFDIIITNPPYKKINIGSQQRNKLTLLNIEISNIYAAFITLSVRFLKNGGQIIAITPRSFANGVYFKLFRRELFNNVRFDKLHIFQTRNKAFTNDKVLQENLIFSAKRTLNQDSETIISTSISPEDPMPLSFKVPHDIIVNPNDVDKVIHIPQDQQSVSVLEAFSKIKSTLDELKISVSTGPVVDFRSKQIIKQEAADDTIPLIYPFHFRSGKVWWPSEKPKKAQFIINSIDASALPAKENFYVVCKRFSSKEEKKRIVVVLFDPNIVGSDYVAFENHINFFHYDYAGLPEKIAKGLTIYLNSTIVDQYFRIFNGHTQVNASDLRMLKYPSADHLIKISECFDSCINNQQRIDQVVEEEIFAMSKKKSISKTKTKIDEAIEILKNIGMPREQLNERSGLTLLALLGLKGNDDWNRCSTPMIGITEIMDYIKKHFKKEYAPNTRETIRRFTVHQFVQAGIVIPNPDKPRAINSPNYVYQIEDNFLRLVKTYGKQKWNKTIKDYLNKNKSLVELYRKERKMKMTPVQVNKDLKLELSIGGQNDLIKVIIEDFCPRFIPGADLAYIGDAGNKYVFCDGKIMKKIGLEHYDAHGKMPDLILFFSEKKWIILIEAVTSHGPMNEKRKIELKQLFKDSKFGLVFVTAFLDKKGLNKYLSQIAWETEVWTAEDPTHLIHFNGQRFLGPY